MSLLYLICNFKHQKINSKKKLFFSFAEIATTKLLSAKRLGMMTFMCRFSTNKQQDVTWLMNGVLDVGKYPQFQVTSKFKKNKGVLISTMKIVSIKKNYSSVKHDFRFSTVIFIKLFHYKLAV